MREPEQENCIKLSFPINAAYVSSARLTASSIASRMNFDVDEIEDIKAAVSEACTYIIKTLSSNAGGAFEINFTLHKASMDIRITARGVIEPATPDDIGLMMIKALVDSFKIGSDDESNITISMTKKHKVSIFN